MDDDQSLAASRAHRELSAEEEQAALHQRAKQAFLELIELPESERAAALERICRGDRTLQEEVASLLVHHQHDSLLSASVRGAELASPGGGPPAQLGSPVGKRVGGIRIERELGAGGMSTVYLGHDARLRRRVALKALRDRGGFDKETRSRFLREARVLSRLKHPNICEIYGYEETAEGDYLILEYIDGRNLREVLMTTLPLRERDRIATTLAQVLQVAHSAGVVHRDLKPENVMLTKDGQIKILDFGIARLEGGAELPVSADPEGGNSPAQEAGPDAATATGPLTRGGRILGTLHYMSPEQARGEPISPASDIFSLGLLLYELYLGKGAYPEELPSPALLARVQKGLVASLNGLGANRRRLLQRMLSADAATRPTATEAAQALRLIRDRWARLARRSAVAAVLCVVVLVAAKYVVDITRAISQAEAARSQLEMVTDMLSDTIFNKLSIRDRRVMLDRMWHVSFAVLQDMPERLLRESLARFANNVCTGGHARLFAGDTAGAQTAFERALWLDESASSSLDNAELRKRLVARFMIMRTANEGRAEARSTLAFYQRAIAFYEGQLARGSELEKWRTRLAMVSIPFGWISLQNGELPAARATFERARLLCSQLVRESSGPKNRHWRYRLAGVMRALAETEYYAGHLDSALAAARDSVHGYEVVVAELYVLPDMQASLGEAYLTLGRVLHAQGHTSAALAALEKARAILTPLNREDPGHTRLLTLLALDHLSIARISRQRGDLAAAQRALLQAETVTDGVTTESFFIAQDARAQALLELGRVEDARPFVEFLRPLGWQNDLTHQDFARLSAVQRASDHVAGE